MCLSWEYSNCHNFVGLQRKSLTQSTWVVEVGAELSTKSRLAPAVSSRGLGLSDSAGKLRLVAKINWVGEIVWIWPRQKKTFTKIVENQNWRLLVASTFFFCPNEISHDFLAHTLRSTQQPTFEGHFKKNLNEDKFTASQIVQIQCILGEQSAHITACKHSMKTKGGKKGKCELLGSSSNLHSLVGLICHLTSRSSLSCPTRLTYFTTQITKKYCTAMCYLLPALKPFWCNRWIFCRQRNSADYIYAYMQWCGWR